MTAISLALIFLLLSTSSIAVADMIVIDGVAHDDVVITIGESHYYVAFPKLGTTAVVSKSEVSDEDLVIESNREVRKSLFAEWKTANTRLREQREEESKAKELEAAEEERLISLAEREKLERARALAVEQIRLEKERLGLKATNALKGHPETLAKNLWKAELAERSALLAELDELEREIERIAMEATDKSKIDLPEWIKKRVEEFGEMGRERAKAYARAENEPGYSLQERKAGMVSVLTEQGMSQSEALATVEDMLRNDMLPDPPVSGSKNGMVITYVYSTSVRRTAAIETLIENGWERPDAEIGVDNMRQDNSTAAYRVGAPVVSGGVEAEMAPSVRKNESYTSEREPVDNNIEREVENNWVPRPGGNTKEDAAWVSRDIQNAKSWEELEEVIRFHDENGR